MFSERWQDYNFFTFVTGKLGSWKFHGWREQGQHDGARHHQA
jgi:hypothetical protein